MKSIPTVIVWDKTETFGRNSPTPDRDDDVWETMKHIDDGSDVEQPGKRKHGIAQ